MEERRGNGVSVCAVESFYWNNAPYFMNKTFIPMKINGEKDINFLFWNGAV